MQPMVSIIIPIFNERLFIEGLCGALAAQSYDPARLEVLFLDGLSQDGTREYLDAVQTPYTKRVLTNEKRKHVFALNQGLREAAGEIILRMDAHATYEEKYVEKCVAWLLRDESVINVGGTAWAQGYDFGSSVIAKIVSSRFGLGGSTYRYADKVCEVDTLFPGAWRKEQLLTTGGWDETQISSQDVELSARMKKLFPGKRYIVDPDIGLSYHPRNTLKKLLQQYLRYGYWKLFTCKKHPELFRRVFVIPFGLLFATLLGLIMIPFFTRFWPLWLSPVFLYLVYTFYAASTFIKGEKKRPKRFLMSVAGLFCVHYGWALGATVSLFKYRPKIIKHVFSFGNK